jgi:hypothetical protein
MKVHKSSCKIPAIFVGLNQAQFFVHIFEKNNQKPNFIEIRLVGAVMFHADREREP